MHDGKVILRSILSALNELRFRISSFFSFVARCLDANLIEIPVEVETPDLHYYHVRNSDFIHLPSPICVAGFNSF